MKLRKTNQSTKNIIAFMLGGFFVFSIAFASTTIETSLDSAIQYIQKIVFTDNGGDTGTTGVVIDGTAGSIELTNGVGSETITTGKISNRNTAYGRGDHGIEGYLTSYTETDPEVGALTADKRCKVTGGVIVCDQNEPAGGGGESLWNTGATNSINYTGGNVGIGTDDPTHRTTIASEANQFLIQNPNGNRIFDVNIDLDSPGGYIKIGDISGTTYGEVFTIDHVNGNFLFESGNVGIGTTNPTTNLEVHDNANTTLPQLEIEQEDVSGDASMRFITNGGNTYSMGIDASDSDKFKISDYTTLGTNERLIIDPAGDISFEIPDSRTNAFQVYNPGDGAMPIHVDTNTKEISFDRAGDGYDVGIGLGGSPTATLDVGGNGKFNGNLTVDTNTLYVNATSNNVGIGTDDPTEKLEINGGNILLNDDTESLINASISTSGYHHTDSGRGLKIETATAKTLSSAGDGGAGGDLDIIVGSGSTVTNGNGGKGGDITINAGDGTDAEVSGKGGAGGDITINAGILGNGAGLGANGSNGDIIMASNGGNVGIGTTSPDQALEVSGYVNISNSTNALLSLTEGVNNRKIEIKRNGTNSFFDFTYGDLSFRSGSSNDYLIMSLLSDGKVGIGTSSPDEELVAIGRIRAAATTDELEYIEMYHGGSNAVINTVGDGNINFKHDNVIKMTIEPDGDVIADADMYADEYYYNSDINYKENLKIIEAPLSKILSLNGYTFDWKENGKHSIGVIAQELEPVFPELVTTKEDGYMSVKYGNLVAPIIEAIKEFYQEFVDKSSAQDREIELLKQEIELLKNTLATDNK